MNRTEGYIGQHSPREARPPPRNLAEMARNRSRGNREEMSTKHRAGIKTRTSASGPLPLRVQSSAGSCVHPKLSAGDHRWCHNLIHVLSNSNWLAEVHRQRLFIAASTRTCNERVLWIFITSPGLYVYGTLRRKLELSLIEQFYKRAFTEHDEARGVVPESPCRYRGGQVELGAQAVGGRAQTAPVDAAGCAQTKPLRPA